MGVINQLSVPLTLMVMNHRVDKKRNTKHHKHHTKHHTKRHTKRHNKRTRSKKSKMNKKRR